MKRFWVILGIYVAAFLFIGEIQAQERGNETWETFTNANYVNALAVEGDYIWAGTSGGVVR